MIEMSYIKNKIKYKIKAQQYDSIASIKVTKSNKKKINYSFSRCAPSAHCGNQLQSLEGKKNDQNKK